MGFDEFTSVPLNIYGVVTNAIILICYGFGALLNCMVFYALFVNRRKVLKRTVDYLCMYLIVIDMIWCISLFITQMMVGVYDGFQGYFGYILCQIIGIQVDICIGNAVCGHLMIAMDRFLRVVAEKNRTSHILIKIWIFCQLYMVSMAVLLLKSKRNYEPMNDGSWCYVPLIGPPNELVASIMCVFFYCLLITFIINTLYTLIYYKVSRVQKDFTDACRSTVIEVKSNIAHEEVESQSLQRHTFNRCVIILGAFEACYTLSIMVFCFKIITSQLVPLWLEAMSTCFSASDVILTPVLIVMTNNEFKNAFFSVYKLNNRLKVLFEGIQENK